MVVQTKKSETTKWIVIGIAILILIGIIIWFVMKPKEEDVPFVFPSVVVKKSDAPGPVSQPSPSPVPGGVTSPVSGLEPITGFISPGPAPVPGPPPITGFTSPGPAPVPWTQPATGTQPSPGPWDQSAPSPVTGTQPSPSGLTSPGPSPVTGPQPGPISFGFQSMFSVGDNLTDITAGIPGNSASPQRIILKTETGTLNRARIIFEFNSSRSPNMSSLFPGQTLPNPAITECYLRINGIHIIRVIYEGSSVELLTYGFYSDSFGNSITDGGLGTVFIKRIEVGTINIDRLAIRGSFTSVTNIEPTTTFEIRISHRNQNLYETISYIEFFTPPGNPSPVWYQDFLTQRFGSSIPNLTDSSLYTHVIVNDRYLFQIASDFAQGNTSIPIIHVDRLGARVKNDFGIGFQIIALTVEFGNFTGITTAPVPGPYSQPGPSPVTGVEPSPSPVTGVEPSPAPGPSGFEPDTIGPAPVTGPVRPSSFNTVTQFNFPNATGITAYLAHISFNPSSQQAVIDFYSSDQNHMMVLPAIQALSEPASVPNIFDTQLYTHVLINDSILLSIDTGLFLDPTGTQTSQPPSGIYLLHVDSLNNIIEYTLPPDGYVYIDKMEIGHF